MKSYLVRFYFKDFKHLANVHANHFKERNPKYNVVASRFTSHQAKPQIVILLDLEPQDATYLRFLYELTEVDKKDLNLSYFLDYNEIV